MKSLISMCLILLMVSCSGASKIDGEVNSKVLPPEISFSDWFDGAPKLSIKYDTLYSDLKPIPKECEITLPNVECFYGCYFSESNQDKTNSQHYLLNSYMIDSSEILYLEVFNYEGRRIFSRSVFDYEFIKKKNNVSRFYQTGEWFVWENCSLQNGRYEVVTTRKIEIYGMSEI